MSASRKAALSRIIKLMFSLLLLGFLYVLLASFFDSNFSERQQKEEFDNIEFGQPVFRYFKNQGVWISRISQQQRNRYVELSDHVRPDGGCAIDTDICILIAGTDRVGINVIFTDEEPTQLPSNTPWLGGFVDPSSGAVFDLWGRAYQHSSANSLKVLRSN